MGICKDVQVRIANIATVFAAALVVDGRDLGEVVHCARVARFLHRDGKVRERHVGNDGAVVRGAGIVLNLLEEHDVWSIQEVGDVVRDDGYGGRRR